MIKRERNMLIALGIIALGALLYFVFVLGGGEEQEGTAPTPTSSPPPISSSPDAGVGEPDEPPRGVTFFGGRDPFVPLIVVPTSVPGDAGTGTDGGTGTGTDGGTGTGTDGGTGTDTGTGGTGGTDVDGDGQSDDTDGITVTGRPDLHILLVEVLDEETVQAEVDDDSYTPSVGETFARTYRLMSVDGSCARFLYGDDSFTLCTRESS